ncbi:DUF4390 domain-containing protein [Variovorax sp. PCZ-1]|uniref:DUF4390 domain-containing protein n=1 Tax=Variovorax sp. PCZ-1 TaxID=2835533 RepID=UPI001BD00CC0|nr:DUF4390 domain-containing protein [Variovorax sp. PCZ-1]MBS7808613.1 DUF4390 domain-containing protein [Variovorax sp. PCZ-1]
MTDFSTRYCASGLKSRRGWLLHVWLACWLALFAALPAQAQNTTDVNNVRLEQTPDGIYLSATLRFELPSAVEDALLKGIAITFVAEALVLRDRWYWYDKNVASATRNVRLSYQPLTRRWRISVIGNGDQPSGASLSQSFDQLADAMAAVRRISRWKIAEGAEIEQDARHNVDFRFRLDTSQLPRPMQIGITGNADWNISVQRSLRPEAR